MVRSLFGALRLASPRWWHYDCRGQPTRTFQPLAGLLPERTTPELAYLQARFAALVSYGSPRTCSASCFPWARKLHAAMVRRQTQAVAQRLEDELGEERLSFTGICQRDREAVREFDSHIRANAGRIPNYGERQRAGEAISTAFTESAVNQGIAKRMVKKQQMRWTPRGAHLLLQVRARILNDQLASDFHRWYRGLSRTLNPTTLVA